MDNILKRTKISENGIKLSQCQYLFTDTVSGYVSPSFESKILRDKAIDAFLKKVNLTENYNAIIMKAENLKFCVSHNFVYDIKEEFRKLFEAEPNFLTDDRYENGRNYDKESILFYSTTENLSLKECEEKVKGIRNIPSGTKIYFHKNWHKNTPDKNPFIYTVEKSQDFNPDYRVGKIEFVSNFINSKLSDLIYCLREQGFLVQVWNKNWNFFSGKKESGEIAIAHGYNKIVGISSNNDTFMGFERGRKNILYDNVNSFTKWDDCLEISKETSFIDDIINKIIK